MIYRVYRGIYRGIIYIVCKMRKKCYNVTKGSKMKESKVERRLVTKIKASAEKPINGSHQATPECQIG